MTCKNYVLTEFLYVFTLNMLARPRIEIARGKTKVDQTDRCVLNPVTLAQISRKSLSVSKHYVVRFQIIEDKTGFVN